MISTVKGRFANVQGMVRMDEADPSTVFVDATIDVASIDTQQEERDRTSAPRTSLMWRGSQSSPSAAGVFRGTRSKATSASSAPHYPGRYARSALDVSAGGHATDPSGRVRAGFSAHTTIDRTDFGLAWNQPLEAGGVLVGNEVGSRLKSSWSGRPSGWLT